MNRREARAVYSLLVKTYPDAREPAGKVCRGTPFEVLILTILSAQTNDRAVLKVKRTLFSRHPDIETLSSARIHDVEIIIHSLGFYHAKAKNIVGAAQVVINDFHGRVPDRMEDLLTIPGVGRKTANIVLYHGYGKNEGIAVDTHVRRLAKRIGFSNTDDARVIERDLMQLFQKKDWGDLTDVLIAHGRACCTARKPQCGRCPVSQYCRYFRTVKKPGYSPLNTRLSPG